jgi:hypothetical protein
MQEVIIAGAAFDVAGDNYEEFDQELDPAKLGDKLIQTNPLKGSVREYQFYTYEHLLVNLVEKKNAKAKKFRINLACLSSEPEHNKIIVWKWLYYALAAGALAILCLFLAISQTAKLEYCTIAGTITLTTALICILVFIYLMRDEYVFKGRFGNAKLFLLENKKPNLSAFNIFFIGLQQNIDKTQSSITIKDSLVNELKMCRHLKDKGIIDDESYTAARTAIFKHEQYNA